MKEVVQVDRRTKKKIKKIYDENDKLISRDCSKCDRHLLFEMFPKTKNKSYKDGIRGQCKECMHGYYKKYEEVNRDELRDYRKSYYQENKEEIDRKNSIYYQNNKEKISLYYKQWRIENKDRLEEYYNNWKEENKDHLYLYKKAYHEANREHVEEYKKEWAEKNQHKVKTAIARRKTLLKKLPSNLTENDWLNICSLFDGKCALTESTDITLDHFIPIYTGHGGTIIGNCYPLDGVTNFSKNKQNPFEWIKKPDVNIDKDKWDLLINMLASQNNLTVQEFTQYVYWCFDNKRSNEEINNSVSSVELWRSAI
jgi:hypothetical protein